MVAELGSALKGRVKGWLTRLTSTSLVVARCGHSLRNSRPGQRGHQGRRTARVQQGYEPGIHAMAPIENCLGSGERNTASVRHPIATNNVRVVTAPVDAGASLEAVCG
jgi:hypothetical protein